MIRLEVVVKDRYGYTSAALERALKRDILAAISENLDANDAEPIRVQFLGAKK